MKVYSDTLTLNDLFEAARQVPNVYVDTPVEIISNPRVRSRGYVVRLGSTVSNRYRNSGTAGAKVWDDSMAASWDDHGHWMARLFDIDPDARIAHYSNANDFHVSTRYAYAPQPTTN